MLYLIVVIISIITALLRGGELENLTGISIQGVLLFVFALILRLATWVFQLFKFTDLFSYTPYLIIMSYLILFFVSMKNMKLPGFKYINLGILLNAFVITVNGGKMPVLIQQGVLTSNNLTNFIEKEAKSIHSLMTSRTLFAFLGDVISLPRPFPDSSIISIGDILILTGLFVLIQKTMMENNLIQKDEDIE